MSESDLDYIVEVYGDGDCGIFASALHEVTGLPLVLFRLDGAHALHLPDRWPRHAAVGLPDGRFLDATGVFSKTEIADRFECRFLVDATPDPGAYPFESAPGSRYFDEEQWSEACRFAADMLAMRGLSCLMKDGGSAVEELEVMDSVQTVNPDKTPSPRI